MEFSFGDSLLEQGAQAASIFSTLLILIAIWQISQERRTAAAQFLIDLNAQWDAEAMIQARFLLRQRKEKLTAELIRDLRAAGRRVDRQALETTLAMRFASHMVLLRTAADESSELEYRGLINVFGFFEAAGLMVRRRYVDKSLILDLFSGPAIDTYVCMHQWVAAVEREPGMAKGFFANAIWLGKQARRVAKLQ